MRTVALLGGAAVISYVLLLVASAEPAARPTAAREQSAASGPAHALSLEPAPSAASPASGGDPRRQGALQDRLDALEARLHDVESARAAQPVRAEQDERELASSRTQISEADLGHFLDRALGGADYDRDGTREARQQLEASLLHAPGVRAQGIDCAQRFCRALLDSRGGEPLDVRPLFALPPLLSGEGFTVEQPDGRVAIYFTRTGESLAELRGDALATR